MILRSTLTNYANHLQPQERLEYLAVIMTLPVEAMTLEARDKMNRLLERDQESLDVVCVNLLERVLKEAGMGAYLADIHKKASMITPVGEWSVFGHYENRASQNGKH